MGKRGRILMAVTAIIVVGAVGWSFFRSQSGPPDPIYKGKPLSYWLRGYAFSKSTNLPTSSQADAALSDAGSNGIPTLLHLVEAHDSPVKASILHWAHRYPYFKDNYPDADTLNMEAVFGFLQLGPVAWPAVPGLVRILDKQNPQNSVVIGEMILAQMGPHADAAVPALLRQAAGSNDKTRATALMALGAIHTDPEVVVPVLLTALRDPYVISRADAAGSLGEFGVKATSAVPALVVILLEPSNGSNSVPVLAPGVNFSVRARAGQALQQIDPETYARVVTNTAIMRPTNAINPDAK